MKKILIMILGGLLLSGCYVVVGDFVPGNQMMDQGWGWFSDNDFSSNGEYIYFTAVNDRGQRIRYSDGPSFGGMMMGRGAYLACVSCHGSDGRGGVHTMHMQVMDAPDIRYVALTSEEEEHGGDHEHEDEHSEYDLEAFRLAVVEGTHPGGEPLSRDMPRWQMSDQDLADLFEYLKTLP